MPEYIVKNVVCDYGVFFKTDDGKEKLIDIYNSLGNAQIIAAIANLDIIHERYEIPEDKKPKTAKWERFHVWHKCTNCQFMSNQKYNYCPSCGRKMKEE